MTDGWFDIKPWKFLLSHCARWILAAAALATLSCGSREEAARQPPENAAPAPATQKIDERPVIAAFGDSLSAGHGLPAGQSYPDYLQELLDEEGYSYRIVNFGLSGDTTSGGVSRLGQVMAEKPEIVILELGANDGLRGIPVEATRSNLDLIIGELKNAGIKVLLAGITLPRNYGMDYINQFDRIYPDLAAKHNVPLLPFLLEGVALQPGMMQSDGLHPTAAGTRKVARNVFAALQPLLGKRPK